MGALGKIFYGSTFAFFGGSYYLHRHLSKTYPDIPAYELPKHTRIGKKFNEEPKGKFIAYCDTFKISLDASKVSSLEKVRNKFLLYPLFNSLIETTSHPATHLLLKAEIEDIKKETVRESTLLKWGWNSPKYVEYFEWLAQYGYPWRLMNGGFHELYIERNGAGKIDVYFATAHEYNNLRDGKLIPKLAQCLHRDYARVLLELSLGEWR